MRQSRTFSANKIGFREIHRREEYHHNTFMGVIKFKPRKTPRLLDTWATEQDTSSKKTTEESKKAVQRSRELIKKSREIMAEVRGRRKKA
jgi:hypothetical protein